MLPKKQSPMVLVGALVLILVAGVAAYVLLNNFIDTVEHPTICTTTATGKVCTKVTTPTSPVSTVPGFVRPSASLPAVTTP